MKHDVEYIESISPGRLGQRFSEESSRIVIGLGPELGVMVRAFASMVTGCVLGFYYVGDERNCVIVELDADTSCVYRISICLLLWEGLSEQFRELDVLGSLSLHSGIFGDSALQVGNSGRNTIFHGSGAPFRYGSRGTMRPGAPGCGCGRSFVPTKRMFEVSGIESCIQQTKKSRQKKKNLSNFLPFYITGKLGKIQVICIKNTKQIRDFAWWQPLDFLV